MTLTGTAAPETPPRATLLQLLGALARNGREHGAFRRLCARYHVQLLRAHCALVDRTVVVVGGGEGRWCAEEFRAAGAHCVVVGPSPGSARPGPGPGPGPATVVGDGYWLPLRDGGADITYFAAHTHGQLPQPIGMVDELIRITRPGGTVCLAATSRALLRHLRGRSDVLLLPRGLGGRLGAPVLRGPAVPLLLRRKP